MPCLKGFNTVSWYFVPIKRGRKQMINRRVQLNRRKKNFSLLSAIFESSKRCCNLFINTETASEIPFFFCSSNIFSTFTMTSTQRTRITRSLALSSQPTHSRISAKKSVRATRSTTSLSTPPTSPSSNKTKIVDQISRPNNISFSLTPVQPSSANSITNSTPPSTQTLIKYNTGTNFSGKINDNISSSNGNISNISSRKKRAFTPPATPPKACNWCQGIDHRSKSNSLCPFNSKNFDHNTVGTTALTSDKTTMTDSGNHNHLNANILYRGDSKRQKTNDKPPSEAINTTTRTLSNSRSDEGSSNMDETTGNNDDYSIYFEDGTEAVLGLLDSDSEGYETEEEKLVDNRTTRRANHHDNTTKHNSQLSQQSFKYGSSTSIPSDRLSVHEDADYEEQEYCEVNQVRHGGPETPFEGDGSSDNEISSIIEYDSQTSQHQQIRSPSSFSSSFSFSTKTRPGKNCSPSVEDDDDTEDEDDDPVTYKASNTSCPSCGCRLHIMAYIP